MYMCPVSPGGGLTSVVVRVLDAVKTEESLLAKRLIAKGMADYVAKFGPRYVTLKDGLVELHEKWETLSPAWRQLNYAVRYNKGDLEEVERALVMLAAAAVKGAQDVRAMAALRAADVAPDE